MHFPIPLCLYLRIYINVKGNVCVRAFVYHIQAAGAILTTFGMQVTSLMRKFWKIKKKSVISLTFHWQKRDKTKHKKPGQHRVTLSVSYIMAGKFCPPLENAEFTSLTRSLMVEPLHFLADNCCFSPAFRHVENLARKLINAK